MVKPWMTSDDLIASIKRKISFPVSQVTFTDDEILEFANEEMMISQVPSIMQFHEEFFVYEIDVPLEESRSAYTIPDRAIGDKLRDLFFVDQQGNTVEMTRVSQDDRAYYQNSNITNQYIKKFYVQGNQVKLVPPVTGVPNGSLKFVFYMRPNQLVRNERAAIVSNFCESIILDNASISASDTVTIGTQVFTAVAGAPSTDEFEIGASSIITATNLSAAINTNGVVSATNGTPSTATVVLTYPNLSLSISTSNTAGFTIPDTTCVEFTSIPSNIIESEPIDFLQTAGGHRTYSYDITIPTGGISGNTIEFTSTDVPEDLVVGDYICLAQECIIPQIPTDLHNLLAERTGGEVLQSIGDQAGLAATKNKVQEMERSQGNLVDRRVDGAPQKVTNRHSLLRYGKLGFYKGRF